MQVIISQAYKLWVGIEYAGEIFRIDRVFSRNRIVHSLENTVTQRNITTSAQLDARYRQGIFT